MQIKNIVIWYLEEILLMAELNKQKMVFKIVSYFFPAVFFKNVLFIYEDTKLSAKTTNK